MVLPKFLRVHDCVHVLCTSSLLRAQQFLVQRLRSRLAIVAIQGVLFAAEESPFAFFAERNCSYLYGVDLSVFVRAFLFFGAVSSCRGSLWLHGSCANMLSRSPAVRSTLKSFAGKANLYFFHLHVVMPVNSAFSFKGHCALDESASIVCVRVA